ncbi:G5 domain-containing protein [Actinomyces weissii]|uniref:G5 domain-containing protein n=1 Tax=Actinomyces weissii TaxID=675090 RepID=A0A7T7MBT7_9ACTO|nr:G5 domain-containing protein [Actinomyces weissii]
MVVDGQGREVSTSAGSWGQALLEAGVGVDTAAGDRVSVALDGVPSAGETVVVDRVVVSSESKEDKEAYATVEEETDELDKGERKVKTPGVDGVTRTTYTVRTVGGQEVSREVAAQVVATAKVDEVVLVGTKEKKQETSSSGSQTGNRSEGSGSGSSGSSGSEAPAPAPAPAPSGTSAADAQATARSMMASYGWGESEFSCLVALWNRESGWNYRAENPYSGAYGIPQSLPGSKMASAGSDWRTNPATQIKWGLGYIQGRYGSPCGAWNHSERVGWY